MPDTIKETAFKETRRVLKEGGEFWIWDIRMTSKHNVFAARVQVDFPEHTIKTMYGAKEHRGQSYAD